MSTGYEEGVATRDGVSERMVDGNALEVIYVDAAR
jgi:hypothetical protein